MPLDQFWMKWRLILTILITWHVLNILAKITSWSVERIEASLRSSINIRWLVSHAWKTLELSTPSMEIPKIRLRVTELLLVAEWIYWTLTLINDTFTWRISHFDSFKYDSYLNMLSTLGIWSSANDCCLRIIISFAVIIK